MTGSSPVPTGFVALLDAAGVTATSVGVIGAVGGDEGPAHDTVSIESTAKRMNFTRYAVQRLGSVFFRGILLV